MVVRSKEYLHTQPLHLNLAASKHLILLLLRISLIIQFPSIWIENRLIKGRISLNILRVRKTALIYFPEVK